MQELERLTGWGQVRGEKRLLVACVPRSLVGNFASSWPLLKLPLHSPFAPRELPT